MTLQKESMERWSERIRVAADHVGERYPGERPDRQPVHTVYGGAQIVSAQTRGRLGELASDFVRTWIPEPQDLAAIVGMDQRLAESVHPKVTDKLAEEPVEDFRIDFEDGYGHRSDEEEDGHARSAAEEVAHAMESDVLPPFIGIRVKSMSGELHRRSLRTLDLFVSTLVERAGRLPDGFAVTLPKIENVEQVVVFAEALTALADDLGTDPIPLELMVETPQMVIDHDGSAGARKFVDAAGGLVRGAHFGTYDYTASMNITASYQTMDHDACEFARHSLQVSLAGTGVWLSDGATNVLPVPIHHGDDLTGQQAAENRNTVHEAMRLHYEHIAHSLSHAYYQGWDLHPAQLATRYAAVFAFFLAGLDRAGARLSNFVESAAKATVVGEVFDDAATGQGLLNYFLRAVNCGAITEDEATRRSGLTLDELRTRSFLRILEGRTRS